MDSVEFVDFVDLVRSWMYDTLWTVYAIYIYIYIYIYVGRKLNSCCVPF